ncbi:MAG TPA: tetratricopeptide repeat protein [Thermoanaerobaculia bacterium]|nr:tetratricopeptide repeat protein [Thermoanaerobaculia bacterium]
MVNGPSSPVHLALLPAMALWLTASGGAMSNASARPHEVTRDARPAQAHAQAQAKAMIARGSELRTAGRYPEAFRVLHEAVAAVERSYGPRSIELAMTLNQFGMAGKYAGELDSAEASYQRALAILGRRPGYELQLADLYHNLGGLEHARRRFAAGEPYARRAVAIRTRVLGPDHVTTAGDLAALAALLEGQRKFDEAEHLYTSVLATFERAYGPVHYEVAINCNNLAALYQAKGRFELAEPLYLRALAIKERLLGARHPDVAMTLNNLAVFYKSQKRYTEAASLYERALKIFEGALGPTHPNVATCRANYAQLRKSMAREKQKPSGR